MKEGQSYIVGITGGSGAGKTLFVNQLRKQFTDEELCLISLDNYYKKIQYVPRDERGIPNFDLPEAIDFDKFMHDVNAILEGKTVEIEEYTFNNPSLIPRTIVFKPAPIIVIEGIFVLYNPLISKLLDLKVFIDVKEHMKLKRRLRRDAVERGYDMDDVLYRYEHHVSPTYERYIGPYKQDADLIVMNNTNFDAALQMLSFYLRKKFIDK